MSVKVLLDTSPLNNAHAIRGVGSYTRFLSQALTKFKEIELRRSATVEKDFSPDLIHYPFFDLFFPTLPIIKKSKTVLTIHDVIPLIYPSYYPVGKRGQIAFIRQKLALKNVEAIITDSESSKKDIQQYLGVEEKKINVVYLAANPLLKVASLSEIEKTRRQFKLPKQYLLYVGDINYNKNLPQLIKTLKFLPNNIKLVCVGKNFTSQDIPEWQWVESQIALSNVEQRVKFLTDVLSDDYDSLSAIYSGALAYIQPSIYEGFGLPVLEAMTCRTPVICANNSSLKEVAGDFALMTEEAAAEAFASQVEIILAWDKKTREDFLNQAEKRAKSFTWQKTAKETLAVYQKVLA